MKIISDHALTAFNVSHPGALRIQKFTVEFGAHFESLFFEFGNACEKIVGFGELSALAAARKLVKLAT